MRILVVGAGAIGGYFGGRLLQAGRDVTFLVRPKRAAQLANFGLTIRSPHGDVILERPPTVLSENIHQPFDLVLLCCKAYDLEGAIIAFAPAVATETVILPLLNGMRHLDVLDARFGRPQVLGGKCLISVTVDEKGTVVHLSPVHALSFGEREVGISARARGIASSIGGALFDVDPSLHIIQEMWEKWVLLSALAASTCLMRASIGIIVASPSGRDVVLNIFSECCAIAEAAGYAPRGAFLEQARASLTASGSPLTASMLRDIERHAPIEAEHIIGDLLRRRSGDDLDHSNRSALRIAYIHMKAYELRRAEILNGPASNK